MTPPPEFLPAPPPQFDNSPPESLDIPDTENSKMPQQYVYGGDDDVVTAKKVTFLYLIPSLPRTDIVRRVK